MTGIDRRRLLALGAASLALPPAIAKAWAIDAQVETGTLNDVQHVVILMQENRSFDHYFGTMNGVRGFGDRFPIPLPGGKTVWMQESTKGGPRNVAPFRLDTSKSFALMRVEGTPHSWSDAQYAWDNGRMGRWPDQKKPHAMAYYGETDIPFQWALANAFTICDAYHCSFMGGTNTNRLFHWTGTNDGAGKFGGPSISNSHDSLPEKGGAKQPYLWTTYCERLEAAGVSWKIYEDLADNFDDNPRVGFEAFQASLAKKPGSNPALAARGLTTQHLDALRTDVMAGTLPQVSWVVSPAADSEHPGPSSPAQGADYIARVLDCLTANPEVWGRTVFLINFDENDGFFDHVPPPAPPSKDASGKLLGASTVDTTGEYHLVRAQSEATSERNDLMGRPYGLGPRVPFYVVSPFARGGWVNSQVFDHTSIIRFLETRFGVQEPNISPWRRAVCGDLSSCFNFETPNAGVAALPATQDAAKRASTIMMYTTPVTPPEPAAPVQAMGVRRSRALPYGFSVNEQERSESGELELSFFCERRSGWPIIAAVFHIYDHLRLYQSPRRYTVDSGNHRAGKWPAGPYDIAVFGPNGFYRRFTGSGGKRQPRVVAITHSEAEPRLQFDAHNLLRGDSGIEVLPAAYADLVKLKSFFPSRLLEPDPRFSRLPTQTWDLSTSGGWYDFVLTWKDDPAWRVLAAGRVETGGPSTSDPAMGGSAKMTWA